MAHYSSLFTLGLLSDRASPPSSPKSNVFYKFRKSSLPTRMLSKPSSEMYATSPSESLLSSPQFTNPFAANSPDSQATTELRSFLSLDLAADKNFSSGKLLSPLDTRVPPAGPANLLPNQRMTSSSWHRSAPQTLPTRRSSRDSLRTLPSPRPAPSSALPDLPLERKEPRALPPIFIPSPALFPLASSSSSTRSAGRGSPTSPRPPRSAPPVTTVSPSSTSSLFLPTASPVSPLSSPNYRSTRQDSFMSFSSSGTVTSFTRTARRRHAERSNALACLEGRSRAPGRVSRSARQRNFMSMSDDEEEARDDEDAGGDADVEDDSDAPERSQTASRSSFVQSPPLSSPARSPVDEEEDRVLPPSASNFRPHFRQQRTSSSSSASKRKSRSRRSTLESWFPLANFIDLKDDELQGWRGVVEIVNGL